MDNRRTTYRPAPLIRRIAFRIDWREVWAVLATGVLLVALIVYAWLLITPAPAPALEPTPVATSEPAVPTWDTEPTPETTPDALPPCPTEDSTGCYWDGETMGNGTGSDVVEPEPEPEPAAEPTTPEPEPEPASPEPASPDAWPFTTGETIVCGHDAKPALDYRDDVGWWAYCEPALTEGE